MNSNKQLTIAHIRWMISRRDMPEVLRIEMASHAYPWDAEDFLRCLRQRNCIGLSAEFGEKIVGFMIYELHKTKFHIINFAVHPDYRRQSVGKQMAEILVSKLSDHRRTRVTVEVRETNSVAQFFFRSMGFRATGVFRQFYADSGEDAYLMEHRLTSLLEDEVVEEIPNRIRGYFGSA